MSRNNLPFQQIASEVSIPANVFAVLFCFLFSIAPHFRHLPLWVSGFVILALSWRSMQNLGIFREVPKWLLVPLVLAGGIGVFAQYWTIVGRDAGLALLTVMASFKFLESRSHRDMLILIFLCYFLIATHFLFSQSIPTAILMLVTLVVITATLVSLNQRDDKISVKSWLSTSSRLILLSLPLMIILFILVPRIPGPIWGINTQQSTGVTGLSDNMAPGKISNLIRSNEVAFRVDFDGEIPAQNQLYWRGPVMASFDGRRWQQYPRRQIENLDMRGDINTVDYTVTLEPNGKRWLLALDVPIKLTNDSVFTADFQLISKEKVNELRRYTTQSALGSRIGVTESAKYLEYVSRYPLDSNPETVKLGRSLIQQYESPMDRVNHVLNLFSNEEYFYTLEPPLLSGDTVDQFLFDTRRGFCEHYASSFALLMRAAGVPARVVTGYQGGEYNQIGNYLIVRQSDAHAWTEVWIEGDGWVRIDPTAAVSPDRIEQGIDEVLFNETGAFRFQNRNPIFSNVLFGWDNIKHSWNDWVINYDDKKQQSFLRKLNIGISGAGDMVIAMVVCISLVTGGYWLVGWYRARPPRPPEYEIEFNRLLKKMAKAGLAKRPSEDARSFTERTRQQGFSQAEIVARIVDLYQSIKYGKQIASSNNIEQQHKLVDSVD